MLYLHQTKINAGTKWTYHDEAGERYGIASPRHGYRKVHPREIGISACPKKIKVDRSIVPAPNVWSLRSKRYQRKTIW